MSERGVGAAAVAALQTRQADGEQLVDVLEGRLTLDERPVAALDDQPRLHRGELALERRRVVALADFALDVGRSERGRRGRRGGRGGRGGKGGSGRKGGSRDRALHF